MATVKRIKNLGFSLEQDRELIQKLNAVAPYQYRRVHDLARMILLQRLNELIEEYGIDINEYEARSA